MHPKMIISQEYIWTLRNKITSINIPENHYFLRGMVLSLWSLDFCIPDLNCSQSLGHTERDKPVRWEQSHWSINKLINKFPLVWMGGWAEGEASADRGARTPIGARGNYEFLFQSSLNGKINVNIYLIAWKVGQTSGPTKFDFNPQRFRG